MKNTRLSTVFIAASAASLLMASAVSFAGHKASHRMSSDMNYKGENFKAEVPAPCPPVMLLRDGFYIGLGAGYDAYKLEQSTTVTDAGGDLLTTHADHALTGWAGQIFAGYGRYFDTFYLGAELSASASDADGKLSIVDNDPITPDTETAELKLKARGSYGIALLPGIKVNDSTLLYVRAGYLRTRFNARETFTDTFTPFAFTASESQWENGFNYGVGMETYLAENVSARGEFTHTSYGSFKVRHNTVDGIDLGYTKFSPSNNEFMLSLIYHA